MAATLFGAKRGRGGSGGQGAKQRLHHRAWRFRIVETPEQAAAFAQIAGCCRLVYNLALEQRRDHGRRFRELIGHGLSERAQRDELPALKRVAPFLAEAPSHCLQEAIHDLDRAFKNFFAKRAAYPKPRRRFESDGFRFPDAKQIRFDAANGLLHLPKFGKRSTPGDSGPLKLIMHRRPKGVLRHVSIVRDGAHWYACLAMGLRPRCAKDAIADIVRADQVRADQTRAGEQLRVIGIDRGVTEPIALSAPVTATPDPARGDGASPSPVQITTPFLGAAIETPRARARTRRLARALARKQRGSNNRLKAKRRLADQRAKQARRRKDQLRKAAAVVVRSADVVVLENLKVRSMTKSAAGTLESPGRNVAQKSGLNREILDKGWGMFRLFVTELADRQGKPVVLVDPKNTSRECAACGHAEQANRSASRFACLSCAHQDHADINAAKVIAMRAAPKIASLVANVVPSIAPTRNATLIAGGTPVSACGELGVTRSMKQEAEAVRLGKDPSMLRTVQALA